MLRIAIAIIFHKNWGAGMISPPEKRGEVFYRGTVHYVSGVEWQRVVLIYKSLMRSSRKKLELKLGHV